MRKDQVFQSYRETDDDIVVGGEELGIKFRAHGGDLAYIFVFNTDTGMRSLAIGPHTQSHFDLVTKGTVTELGEKVLPNQGYETALLIERGIRGGKTLDEAITLAKTVGDYDALDRQLGNSPAAAPPPVGRAPG